jgi:DNA invertase Pin-like site-specific DNA recombinase
MELVGVYIDITGNKNTYKRPEMVRLLNDCRHGRVDVIVMQTRAYFAANSEELCFLIKYLFTLPHRIDVVTDDNDRRIDTILNVERQWESLLEMADKYSDMEKGYYEEWKRKLETAMDKLASE